MATDNLTRKSIPLASPDFDAIKASLKEYLKAQDELADYDFESSTSAALIDLLSLNSHFNAFYLNQVGNEAFLATAVKRDSVVARASALNYVPRSAVSASAQLFVEFVATGNPDYIDIPADTIFTASAGGQTFYFRTDDVYRIYRSAENTYRFDGVEIIEGKKLTHTFSIDASVKRDGVSIPNVNVDSSRLVVDVRDNTTSASFVRYSASESVLDIDSESLVYFVSEREGGLVGIQFGDDVLGRSLILGGEVRVAYFISSGAAANGIGAFTLASPIPGATLTSLVVVTPAAGGSVPESIESIKFNAPKAYEAQERAVTASDYTAIIRRFYSNLEDIIAYGGEEVEPPQFGKVFISIKPTTGFYLTEVEKEKVKALVKKYNVLTVRPVVVDADFIFVDVDTSVDFDGTLTDLSDGQMKTLINDEIESYNTGQISKFDKELRFSVLMRMIDNAEASIISNTTRLSLAKRSYAKVGGKQDLDIDFNNTIVPGTLVSSKFTFNNQENCYFEDNEGIIQITKLLGTGTIIVAPNYGTVNYETGYIQINGFETQELSGQFVDELTGERYIRFTAEPSELNVNPDQRQIVVIDNINVTVNRQFNYRV